MRIIIFSLISLLLFTQGYSNDGVHIGAEPAWLSKINPDLSRKPSPASISGGYFFELVEEQTNLLSNVEYHHSIKQIVNESGVQNASEISVSFSPEFEHVIFHKLMIDRNGTIINALKASQIKVVHEESDAADFEYNGMKRGYITLKDVQIGDKIEFSYSITGFNPVFGKKYSAKTYFVKGTEICNYFKTIVIQQDRKLYVDTFNSAPRPSEQLNGNFRIYSWSNPILKEVDSDSDAPSWYTDDPYASITEFSNWKEVADWGLTLFNDYKYELPSGLKSKISGWQKASAGDRDMFANFALRFVQNEVRYLGLEIGEHTHRPYTPAEVYSRRFGDCKDKALLLATILQQENIAAYVALVNSDVIRTPTSEPPAATAFDHAIVAIERSSGYIFVDPTLSMQRGELNSLYIPDYGYSLILKKGQTELSPVEIGSSYKSSIKEVFNIKYKDSSRFSVKTVYSDGAADDMRRDFSMSSAKEIEDSYQRYYSKTYDGIVLQPPVVMKDDSLNNIITIEERYVIPKIWGKNDKGRTSFEVYAKPLAGVLPDPSSISNAPIAIFFPRSIQYIVELNMPETWSFDVKPLHVKNDYFQFDFVPAVDDNQILLSYDYKAFTDHIPAEALEEYKIEYKKIFAKLDFDIYNDDLDKTERPDLKPGTNSTVYWPAIWIAFFLVVFLTAVFRKLNNRKMVIDNVYNNAWPLGGWVIFLGVTLGISVIVQMIAVFNSNYFSESTWTALKVAGGQKLQFVLMLELGLSIFAIFGSGSLIYWLVGRRDIFPKMFIAYVCGLLILRLALTIAYSSIPYPSDYGDLTRDSLTQLFRIVIYGAVWIGYVLRSDRIKNTFVLGADSMK